MSSEISWITQGDDACCFLYGLCNAKRYLGYETPQPGDPEWEELVDIIGCRHGASIYPRRAAKKLGLGLSRVDEELKPPAILTVVNPCAGHYLHACLFLGLGHEGWRLVGYRTDGPVEEYVDGKGIWWPGPPNDHHYNVRLVV